MRPLAQGATIAWDGVQSRRGGVFVARDKGGMLAGQGGRVPVILDVFGGGGSWER